MFTEFANLRKSTRAKLGSILPARTLACLLEGAYFNGMRFQSLPVKKSQYNTVGRVVVFDSVYGSFITPNAEKTHVFTLAATEHRQIIIFHYADSTVAV